MSTIIKIMESLVKMNGWEVERFDIQAYHFGNGIDGYVGYLTIKGEPKTLLIRKGGSFEWFNYYADDDKSNGKLKGENNET